MIDHIILILIVIIIYEYIKYTNLFNLIKLNLKTIIRIKKILTLEVSSDFRKQKILLKYSKLLFLYSFKIFTIFILILFFILLLHLLFPTLIHLLTSTLGIFEISIFYIIYNFIRIKYNA